MNDDLLARIQTASFRTVRLRGGYDVDEVDRFLDRLAAGLRAGEDIRSLLSVPPFPLAGWRPGYDVDDVDAFLAELRVNAE
jgi:DivIVA domain-containing protein